MEDEILDCETCGPYAWEGEKAALSDPNMYK
jgi:hypothetical protein